VLLALLVRGPRLGESLWYDEIAAWREYGVHGPGRIVSTYFDPSNHVAHTLLTWASMRAFAGLLGQELALRLPALLFSLLAVGAMAGLGRAAGGRRVGRLAASLAALAPVLVLEGVEARGYSMMVFFAAASTTQLLAALDGRGRHRWAIYAALAAAGTWAHPVTAFVTIGHAAWIAARSVRRRTAADLIRGGPGIVAAGVVALALYVPIIDDLLRIRGTFSGTLETPSPFGVEAGHTLLQLGGAWAWWAALPGLVLAALGLETCVRDERMRDAVLASLLGLPILWATLAVTSSWMYARFALFAVPGGLLLVAAGLDVAWRWRRSAGLLALAVLLAGYAVDLATRPSKQPLREAADLVRRERAASDTLLVIGLRHSVMDAYAGDLAPVHSLRHGDGLDAELAAELPTWIVMLYPARVHATRHELLARRGYDVVARYPGWVDWGHGDVVVLRLNRDGAPRSDPAGSR
jgi:hypothetical protein